MEKERRKSLNYRLMMIALTAFIPMTVVLVYALASLSNATSSYSEITQSVAYANQMDGFKERMDYSMYLAVIGKKDFEELGDGEVTVNGIVTANPYTYIEEMETKCAQLSEMATVDINRNQITRLHNTLASLEQNVAKLEEMIDGAGSYEESMIYLDENIYMLTTIVQDGIQEYIRVETTNLTEVRRELDKHNKQVYGICIFISVIAIVMTVILAVKALRSITKPIRKLCDHTQKVAEGDFAVRSEIGETTEIAVLAKSFNGMTEEIGTLIENIKEQQKNLHLMEMKLLQAQINPHFLYNTLDTIVWLAEDDRSEEVVAMVTSLSEFFRTTLSKGKDFITVEEEEIHVNSYLKIQQFRYQDIMDYEIKIDKNMKDYFIPKLLLQPLVENALYHGAKNKRGKSMISITGYQEEEKLIFKIKDTGKGMRKETIEKLKKDLNDASGKGKESGYGLVNINQRIRHYYGKEYGLFIESEENKGTEATIIIKAKNIPPFA